MGKKYTDFKNPMRRKILQEFILQTRILDKINTLHSCFRRTQSYFREDKLMSNPKA